MTALDEAPSAVEPPNEAGPLSQLIDRIVAVHHAGLRQELPRLLDLADRAADPEGAGNPVLGEIREVVAVLKADLESHMLKEEWIVFPRIKDWECARATGLCSCCLECSFRKLDVDHRDTTAALARLRALTGGYAAGPDDDVTYRALVAGLAAFEADVLQHLYEENELLFPRACVAASLLRARAAAECQHP